LGELDLRLGELALPALESARAESLLAYLLLHRDAAQPRQRLAFLLWPDSTEAQARTNLRHVLHTLRRALPHAERFLDVTPEDWDRIIAINLTGTFHVTQSVVPDMVEAKWGRIVNISSSSAQTGAVMMAPYSASKGGMIALTKTLALELGPLGITVNTIPPGAIDTPMSRRAASEGRFGGGTLEDVGRHLPVKRIGIPEDIAAACAFLVSDEAGYVTGQIIGVNGGRVT